MVGIHGDFTKYSGRTPRRKSRSRGPTRPDGDEVGWPCARRHQPTTSAQRLPCADMPRAPFSVPPFLAVLASLLRCRRSWSRGPPTMAAHVHLARTRKPRPRRRIRRRAALPGPCASPTSAHRPGSAPRLAEQRARPGCRDNVPVLTCGAARACSSPSRPGGARRTPSSPLVVPIFVSAEPAGDTPAASAASRSRSR